MKYQGLVSLSRRSEHWFKAGLIFTPIVFDKQLFTTLVVSKVAIGFILIYLVTLALEQINFPVIVEWIPQRPLKLGRIFGLWLGILLCTLVYSASLFGVLLAYSLCYVLYEIRLKEVVLLDIFIVVVQYLLSVFAGTILVPIANFSPWLYVSIALLASFITISKRRRDFLEMEPLQEIRASKFLNRDYNLPLLDDMLRLTIISLLITYTLYSFSTPASREHNLLLLTVPFVVYGFFRYLYLLRVRNLHATPESLLFTDRPLLINFLLWGASVLVILYIRLAL